MLNQIKMSLLHFISVNKKPTDSDSKQSYKNNYADWVIINQPHWRYVDSEHSVLIQNVQNPIIFDMIYFLVQNMPEMIIFISVNA